MAELDRVPGPTGASPDRLQEPDPGHPGTPSDPLAGALGGIYRRGLGPTGGLGRTRGSHPSRRIVAGNAEDGTDLPVPSPGIDRANRIRLDTLTATDPRAKRLQTIPGVGPRTAEAILAILDDSGRFPNGKQVGAYIGLAPRQYQSGQTNRQGRISGAGNPTLRTLLIEVSWIGLRYNPWMREVYERVRAGSNARKKLAIVAVA